MCQFAQSKDHPALRAYHGRCGITVVGVYMRPLFQSALAGCVLLLFAGAAHAAVVQTFGSGTAVTSVQGTADFETANSFSDNPYLEGGMSFSRTNLTFQNNALGVGAFGFTGNYMYGQSDVGNGGYFTIAAVAGSFKGLEFLIGNGYGLPVSMHWEAYLSNTLVGSGGYAVGPAGVLGFSDALGFDQLRFTVGYGFAAPPSFSSTFNAPAFDAVRAEFAAAAVVTPVPAALPLFATGLGALVFLARRRAVRPQRCATA